MLPNKNGRIILEKKQLAMIMNNFFCYYYKGPQFDIIRKEILNPHSVKAGSIGNTCKYMKTEETFSLLSRLFFIYFLHIYQVTQSSLVISKVC